MGFIRDLFKKRPTHPLQRITDDDITKAKETHLPSLMLSMGFPPQSSSNERYTYFSPLRAENNPSFQVNYFQGRWTWRDWGTGEYGDAIALVERHYQVDFLEAIRILIGKTTSLPSLPEKMDNPLEKSDMDKISWVREIHHKCLTATVNAKDTQVEAYFHSKKVKFHKEMGVVKYTSLKDNMDYVAIPIPTPGRMIGLECRGLGQHVRKTFGKKVLWTLERDPARVLICESILDALAGEILINDFSISLGSLNGVSNVELLEEYFRQLRPSEVVISLDADESGEKATARTIEIARSFDIRIKMIEEHKKAGVKDLHKLLLKMQEKVG